MLRASMQRVVAALSILAVLCPMQVQASSDVALRRSSLRANVDADAFRSEIKNAVDEVLGCGGELPERHHTAAIEGALAPLWQSLPKNSYGWIERRMLRHLVHRYFVQTSSITLRGFEPSRLVNESSWGVADLLSEQVPTFVESILESRHAKDRGFDLQDAVQVVAMLERLVFDADIARLEAVYAAQSKPTDRALTNIDLEQVLEEYMVRWMMGDDAVSAERLLSDKYLIPQSIPHWDSIVEFARGQLRAMDFRWQRSPADSVNRNAMGYMYSFHDVGAVVSSITRSFGSFWNTECDAVKEELLEMDTHRTGRIPLSKFYSSGNWRFAESEAYLRELGALDETSTWRGTQLIIPNYVVAAPNCLAFTTHYLVCCLSPCEGIFGEIEAAVGSPMVSPQEILSVVRNMSAQTTLDDAGEPHISGSMTRQLEHIASVHGGEVPLHGRLFKQWLHYAFPRDCPFPHRMGTAAARTPFEYGSDFIVWDRQTLASSHNVSDLEEEIDKDEWMSQWSSEEELLSDYNNLPASSETSSWLIVGAVLLVALGMTGAVDVSQKAGRSSLLPTHVKAHFV